MYYVMKQFIFKYMNLHFRLIGFLSKPFKIVMITENKTFKATESQCRCKINSPDQTVTPGVSKATRPGSRRHCRGEETVLFWQIKLASPRHDFIKVW